MRNNNKDSKKDTKNIDPKFTKTTGHNWDGIKEYDTPVPRWWLIVWIISIIYAVIYWIVYPAWPTKDGNTKGITNWSSTNELAIEQDKIFKKKKDLSRQNG